MLPLVHTVSNVLCCCCCVTSLGECGSGWMMNKLSDGYKFFFNVHSLAYSFERGDGVKKDYALLTRDEIQVRRIAVSIASPTPRFVDRLLVCT